jgi:hypothetical protein
MTAPKPSLHIGEADTPEGANIELAMRLIALLRAEGKSPTGAVSGLLLAYALILLRDSDEDRERQYEQLPQIMRDLVGHLPALVEGGGNA